MIRSAYFFYNPLGWPVGSTTPNGVNEWDGCSNAIFDGSGDFQGSWSTANTAIATVNFYAVHTAVSVGSTTSSASAVLNYFNVHQQCPLQFFNPGGADNVADGFTIGYSAFIDVDNVMSGSSCSWIGPGRAGQPIGLIYIGDANRGTYRAAEQIQVIPDLQQSSNFFQGTGESRNYGKNSPANGSTLSSLDEDNIRYDCYLWNDAGHIDQPFSYNVTYPAAHQSTVQEQGSAYNPLESSLATIQWNMYTLVDDTNPSSPTAAVNYNHTCFPAHQIKVNGTVVYSYHPPREDATYIGGCLLLHQGMIGPLQTNPVTVPSH